MPRITVINLSLRAFVCGLFGVLPVIGLVPGLYALSCCVRIRRRYPHEWNPASGYLSWGTALAVLGLGITAVGIPATLLSLQLCRLQSGQ
jgi:hypothetical protein